MRKKHKKINTKGPVIVILIMTIIISLISFLFSMFGIEGYKTIINNDILETSLVTVNNVFSIKGIKYIIGNAVNNFQNFKPLILLIISLIGIGSCEKSGFFKDLFSPLRKVKISIIIFFTLFIGIIFSIIGDYSFIFLLPLAGVIYKYIGKNPVLGILIMFLGLTLGYGTGLIFNYNDYLMGNLTELSATIEVDKNYKYNLMSNIYIMITSTFILPFITTIIINKFFINKFNIKEISADEELEMSKKAKRFTLASMLVLSILIIYMILPIKLPGAGILLDNSSSRYMDKLFSSASPFSEGIVILITFALTVCGWIYGKISGNLKNGHDFSVGLSKNFEGLGYVFVLMFFFSQMSCILEWTNIGQIVGSNLINWLGTLKFSGIPLILTFFIISIVIGLLIPGTIDKWTIMAPTVIPLFMRSNITPGFTQFIFKISDGIAKSITPMFAYFIIMLALLEKYNNDDKLQISIFGTIKLIFSTVLMVTIVWILIILLWYIIGIPIGVGVITTL